MREEADQAFQIAVPIHALFHGVERGQECLQLPAIDRLGRHPLERVLVVELLEQQVRLRQLPHPPESSRGLAANVQPGLQGQSREQLHIFRRGGSTQGLERRERQGLHMMTSEASQRGARRIRSQLPDPSHERSRRVRCDSARCTR